VEVRALETFLECPRRYWYAHVLELQGSADAGSAHFQRTVRRTLSRVQAEGAAGRSSSVLEEEWRRDHAPFAHEQLYLQRARILVEQAVAGGVSDPERDAAFAVQCRVVLPNGSILLSLDRLERDELGRPIAVRFRTGRPRPDHHSDTRSALYTAALRGQGTEGTVLQHYLSTGEARGGRARPATLESRLDEVNDALQRIARAEFPASAGDHCDFCVFRLVCSRK
jgi:CRISPR/Cas system-associated exonuclease Cas4 (RecB family)